MSANIICELDEQQCRDSCEHKGRKQFCPSNKNRVPEPVNTLREQITTILTNGIQGTPDGYFIHGAIDKLESLLQGDAVEFAKWIKASGYKIKNNWYHKKDEAYTTEQLYKKYQEENK